MIIPNVEAGIILHCHGSEIQNKSAYVILLDVVCAAVAVLQ